MRALGIDPVHDTRRTFDALLEVMSRPGTIAEVPRPADHAVVSTVVDHEVTLATDDDELRSALAREGRLEPASWPAADVVHAHELTGWDVRECKRGSLSEPSEGATIVYRVDALGGDSASTVRLAGPGIDGTDELSVGLPPSELDAIATAQADYPRGVDVIVTTRDRVAALPRSVTMEVA